MTTPAKLTSKDGSAAKSAVLSYTDYKAGSLKVAGARVLKAKNDGPSYSSCSLTYNGRNSFKIEGPRMKITGPELRENKFNPGKKDFIAFAYLTPEDSTSTKEQFQAWIAVLEEIRDEFGEALKPQAVSKFGIHAKLVDEYSSWVTGITIRYPKDKDSGATMTDMTPYHAFKCTDYTIFAGLDGETIPHPKLKGMELIGFPMLEFYSVYVKAGQACVQCRLSSFLVEDMNVAAPRNEQMEHIKSLASDSVKVAAYKKKKAEALAAKAAADLLAPSEPEEPEGTEESSGLAAALGGGSLTAKPKNEVKTPAIKDKTSSAKDKAAKVEETTASLLSKGASKAAEVKAASVAAAAIPKKGKFVKPADPVDEDGEEEDGEAQEQAQIDTTSFLAKAGKAAAAKKP